MVPGVTAVVDAVVAAGVVGAWNAMGVGLLPGFGDAAGVVLPTIIQSENESDFII